MLQIVSQSAHGLSLVDFRDHMRVTGTASDDALQRALDAAVVQVENQAGIYLRTTTLRQYFRGAPTGLRIQAQPISSTPTIYAASNNAAVETTAYERDRTGGVERIRVLSAGAFASDADYYVQFDAGYATIPAPILVAVHELAGLHFENREAATPVQLYALPFSVRNILAPYHSGAI